MFKQIDCQTCEIHMNNFLERDVYDDDLWDFLNHILYCETCYEELETRYLISEALIRLENGETIDLKKELRQKVNGARKALRLHSYVEQIYSSIEVVAAVIMLFTILNALMRYL